MTIVLNANDILKPHSGPKALTHILKWMKKPHQKLYGDKIVKIKTSWRKSNNYLGIIFDFKTTGYIKTMMFEYINNVYDYLIHTIQMIRLCPIPLYITPSNYRTIQIHYLRCNQNILLINCQSSTSIKKSHVGIFELQYISYEHLY